MRVALLTSILSPYRVPPFRALASTPGLRLRVFVNAVTEFDRSWELDPGGLDVEMVASASVARGDRTLHVPLPWKLLRGLRRFRPDVVLSAELGARTLLAWLFCALARIPLVIWVEPTRARLAAAGALRRALGPFLLARARAVVVPGREARRALRALGVPEARLFDAPNAHDVEGFAKALAALDHEALHRDLRAGLGCRARIVLVAGRLFPVKGVEPLLVAWNRLAPDVRRDWTLLFVGDGPLAGCVAAARDTHLPGEIVRLPALQPRELIELYAAADLLVFPSLGDVWGLTVNEALACGLPVLCSTRAGCAEDLVSPGENGWLADPLDEERFAAALGEALRCGHRKQLGDRGRETVAGFTPEAMAQGFRRALHHALGER
jgi:glycosyltransferase involved in cell wall biosynthesis